MSCCQTNSCGLIASSANCHPGDTRSPAPAIARNPFSASPLLLPGDEVAKATETMTEGEEELRTGDALDPQNPEHTAELVQFQKQNQVLNGSDVRVDFICLESRFIIPAVQTQSPLGNYSLCV